MTKPNNFDYADELIRLDELPDTIFVPGLYESQVASQIRKQEEMRFNGRSVKYTMPIRPRIPDPIESSMSKSKLVDYLLCASTGPCYCGSGKMWERCCAREDLPKLVDLIVGMNIARG